MKPEDWDEIVEWIDVRFPKQKWKPEQAVAYFHDLAKIESEHIWASLHKIYEAGTQFAPNGSQLLAASRDARRQAAIEDRYRGLPETRGDPIEFDEWTHRRFGEQLSGVALVERIHADMPPCNNRSCELHYKEE